MKAIQLTAYGDPVEGLTVVEIAEPPPPGDGQVMIQVEFSPVNISDLLLARGIYMVHPDLPSVIGNEGTGTIVQVGANVKNVKIGDRVLVPLHTFAWAQKVLAPANGLFVVPPNIDPRQAAMLSINPPTAALLLSEYVKLEPGDWIVQNAANSGVGRSVIAFAKARGLKTVNIVRRNDLIDELKSFGADVVVLDNDNTADAVKSAVGEGKIRLGLDAVGGAAASKILDLVSPEATIVAFSSMTGSPMSVDALEMIAKRVTIEGFFMYYPEFLPKLDDAIAESAALVSAGKIDVPVAAVYPLTEIKAAVAHVITGGKVLLSFQESR